MRSLLSFLGALLCTGATLLAQGTATPTALGAIKLLPKGEAQRIARIEAREGTPDPSRWHILVHDPEEKTGVREYVIAGDEIVASRNVSQFTESLKESDVIGAEAIRIDSDKVSKLAQQYALANSAGVAAMDYELLREGEGAAPLWKVTCFNEEGKTVGSLVVTASKGTVVSHEGFPIQPAASQEKLAVQADPLVGETEAAETGSTATATVVAAGAGAAAAGAVATKAATTTKPVATPKKKTTSTTQTKRRSNDDDDAPRRRGFGRRVGGKLQKFFTGRDTISR